MNGSRNKLRAVALAFVMVMSVFGGTVAFSGSVTADATGTNDGSVSPSQILTGSSGNTLTVSTDLEGVDLSSSSSGSTVEFTFPSDVTVTAASSPSVSSNGGSFSSVSVSNTGNDVTVTFDKDGGGDADSEVTVSTDVTVDAASGGTEASGDIVADVDANGDGTIELTGETIATLDVADSAAPSAGSVTLATSDNPSPSENRGVAISDGNTATVLDVTEYTTADDVLGGVGDGAVIFQGEEDIIFEDATSSPATEVNPSSLERTGGDNEGVTLQLPIPEDQAVGGYNDDPGGSPTFGVTVQQPRVTTLEVQNDGENDVSGGILESDQDDASVLVEYNFEEAENIELTVEDENGVEVTGEALDTGEREDKNADSATVTGSAPDGQVRFELNPSNLDEGDYTFSVAGVEDLDSGSASQSVTTTISADQTASLSLSESEVIQGSDTTFTIENSPEGEFHPVVIEASDFRDGTTVSQAQNVFRSAGDTTDSGVVNDAGPGVAAGVASDDLVTDTNIEYAFGIVEIDGGNGIGSIETQFLDDSSATIELYPSDGIGSTHPSGVVLTTSSTETDDEEDLDIVEGDISLSNPSDTYVTGSEIDLNGTANEGIDEVAVYARDNQNYELVTIDGTDVIQTEGDDSFEETDVVLSDGNLGNNILSLPGTYRIGVISAQDADTDATAGPDDELTTSEFNRGLSSQQSLRVLDTALDSAFTTYNGQIASDDAQITFSGNAPGKSDVVVAFVGPRGQAIAQSINVDDDDTFSEEDFSLAFRSQSGTLSEGTVSAHIISSGRDGGFGDGFASSESDFADIIRSGASGPTGEDFSGNSNTGDQVRELIISNSVDDTASDDLITTETFRFADGLTTIDSLNGPVATNGTIEVQGQTNQRPDENVITVELLDEAGDSVTISDTEQWGTDGNWNATVELSAVEPGNYTVEADDGDNSDRASIQVVEQVTEETPTPEPTATEEPTPTATEEPTPTATEEPTPTATATEEPETTTSSTGTPGFGVVVALIALIATALLAVRRNN